MGSKTLGQKIEYYRKRAKMSQLDLEIEIGAGQGSLSRIENDQVNPTKETLTKIIEVLNLSEYDAAELFGIKVDQKVVSFVRSANRVTNKLDLDYVLQSSVDDIIQEFNLVAGFIVLVQSRKLYAKTTTNNLVSKVCLNLIPSKFSELSVDIDKDKENLMVKTFNNKEIYISNGLSEYVVPAVNIRIAKLMQSIANVKSGISLPIILEDECLGVIYFCTNYATDFQNELEFLKAYADNVAIAISNARKYEELEKEVNSMRESNGNSI